MSAKTKTGLSETPPTKASPATPRVARISRNVATKSQDDTTPSPLQNPRLSLDRSPRSSVSSKPAIVDRRSPKVTPPPATKPATRTAKGSDLQSQLNLVQEDLKKAKEQISLLEREKEKALDELKQAQALAEGANEKLRDAMVAQKRAEESSEIEKFRAIEMEQAGIEAAQKKEDEWMKELETVRNQHALDVAALLSTTQELQKAQLELAMACDAKNQALIHADDATKIAEIHAEKVETLSAELTRLKASLDSKLEVEATENNKVISQLREEADCLRQQLVKAKVFEAELAEKESSIEQLNVELEAAKMAESYACSLVEEWKNKVDELEMHLGEVTKLERSASESLDSLMKQLEQKNDSLHDAESEVDSLREKVGLLEMALGRQKDDLQESEHELGLMREQSSEMAKLVDSLKVELETVKEEKLGALNNEKHAASTIQSLLEEKNKLLNDLKTSKEEEEKSKKAMESLASALHEVSAEARDAKEKLLCIQIEHESCETQMEDLRLVLKATNEKYESMLDDARHEIDLLSAASEQSKDVYEKAKAEWEQKEQRLVDCVKQSKAENYAAQREYDELVDLLKQTEEEAHAAKEGEARLKDNLKKVEADVSCLQGSLVEAKAETAELKESFLEKEYELQRLVHENEELQTREEASLKKIEELQTREDASLKKIEELQNREEASLKKIEELSRLLEEALAKNQHLENGELTDSEKEYDLLPKVVEFSEENGHGGEEKHKKVISPQDEGDKGHKRESSQEENSGVYDEAVQVGGMAKMEVANGDKEILVKDKEGDSVEAEFKMWESCKIEKKEFSPEREAEQGSFEEESDSKADGTESVDQANGTNLLENHEDGMTSPSKQQSQKKKKPLLRKFGSLLKKKGATK